MRSIHLALDNLRCGTQIAFLCANKSSAITGLLLTFGSPDFLLDDNCTAGPA